MKCNKAIGNLGEDIAVSYLEKNKFTILERNYRYKRCEIDIIAEKDNCIYFIEVKIRKSKAACRERHAALEGLGKD